MSPIVEKSPEAEIEEIERRLSIHNSVFLDEETRAALRTRRIQIRAQMAAEDPARGVPTLPADPKLPSDMAPMGDTERANADIVRATLESVSKHYSDFERKIDARFDKLFGEFSALNKMIVSRFNDVDTDLDHLQTDQRETNRAIGDVPEGESIWQTLDGVNELSKSNFDEITGKDGRVARVERLASNTWRLMYSLHKSARAAGWDVESDPEIDAEDARQSAQ